MKAFLQKEVEKGNYFPLFRLGEKDDELEILYNIWKLMEFFLFHKILKWIFKLFYHFWIYNLFIQYNYSK